MIVVGAGNMANKIATNVPQPYADGFYKHLVCAVCVKAGVKFSIKNF